MSVGDISVLILTGSVGVAILGIVIILIIMAWKGDL